MNESRTAGNSSAFVILFLGVAAVSTGAILVKMCKLSPLTVGAYRMSIGLPLFWWWASRSEPAWWKKISRSDFLWINLSGLSLGLHFATWIASLSYTSVTSSVVLVTTNPIFVAIGSVILLKEPVSKRLWLGTLGAFLGTVLVALGSPVGGGHAPQPWLGNGLALCGAIFMSAYLLIGRRLSEALPTACYVASVYSSAALVLWTGVFLTASPLAGFTNSQWIYLGLLALVPQGIGHTLLNNSLKKLSASIVAVAILAEPIFATLLAIPVLGEVPTPLQLVGGLAVVLGVALATRGVKT